MTSLNQLIQDLVEEFTRVQAPEALPEKIAGKISLPGLISTGNGGSIATSREMERLIKEIAKELKSADKSIANRFTDREWDWLVRGTFGSALATVEFAESSDHNGIRVLKSVQSQLTAAKPSKPTEHGFGCNLFSRSDVAPFAIGPVTFEARLIWLDRKETQGGVSKITARRIRTIWAGKKVAKRKNGFDAHHEKAILDAIKSCQYVCSVSTIGLASEAGRNKAQVAAHMAMTAIALTWATPSRAMEGFRLLTDPGVRLQRSLVFVPGIRILPGSNIVGNPFGPGINPAEWAAALVDFGYLFATIGEAIDFYLSLSKMTHRPRIMNLLSQAILWFYEACREEVHLMAIVKFSATLDALASGGKSGGIRRLANARLKIQDSDPIRKGGPTLKSVIDDIYSTGRSRTIHGTNERIGEDWSELRNTAEHIARACLIFSIYWISLNPHIDDPACLQK